MKNKKLTIILICVALVLAVGIGLLVSSGIVSTVDHALRISGLLEPMLTAQNQTVRLSVTAKLDGKTVELESDVYLVSQEDVRYLVLEQGETPVYITGNLLLLENGKAFRISEGLQQQTQSYEQLLPAVAALYENLSISAAQSEAFTDYTVTVTNGRMDAFLAAVLPEAELSAGRIRHLELSLREKEEKLHSITLSGEGAAGEAQLQLQVTLSGFRVLAAGDYPVPEAVTRAAAEVDPQSLFSLTEDLFRLVPALMPLTEPEQLSGSLTLTADCGPLQFDTRFSLSQLQNTASDRVDPEQLQALPEVLGWLCMEGDIRCTRTGTGWDYVLELDRQAIGKLVGMLLPELEQYADHLTLGTLTVRLESGRIVTMTVRIEGKLSALLVQIPLAVSAEFAFDQTAF